MFDPQKPTTQMLGRWQPWHPGHTALFKKAFAETGQVVSPDSKESQFAVRILGHKNKLKQGVSENFADGKVKWH